MRMQSRRQGRRGATIVEFVFVAVLLFMMLFGILEYARFLFLYHLTNNAARDAARFASVHTGGGTMPGEPANITADDVKLVWRTGVFNNTHYGVGMVGMENQITGWAVDVFAVPDADLYAPTPNLDPVGKPVWNTATFHQQIAVRVNGTYRPVLPNLIGLSSDIPFTVVVLVSSEAN